MKKIYFVFSFFIIFGFLFWQCSKNYNLGDILDSSAPKVLSTSPADNEYNVNENTEIVIAFSESLQKDSVNSSVFTVTPSFSFHYSVSGNNIKIIPDGSLTSGQKFWIKLSKNISDKQGNQMAQDYEFAFKIRGRNLSQSLVSFRVDASADKSEFPVLYIAGSWDVFGDYDSQWNQGIRYALYDDGTHNDKEASDGIFGCQIYLSADLAHSYTWVVDNDNNAGNGYIKSQTFSVPSGAPLSQILYLYPPQSITFNYYDIEHKVTSAIYLRGEFNDYGLLDKMSGPSGTNRKFTITKSIREGTYSYKYFADNDWDKVNQDNRTISVVHGGSTVENDYYIGGNEIVLNYYDIEHKVQNSIYAKGDFNGWSDANLMSGPYGTNRRFTTTIKVRSGVSYNYKYLADGDWDKVNKNNRILNVSSSASEINDYYMGPLTVIFHYYDKEGNVHTSIHIAGDFNGWSIDYPYQMTADSVTNYKYTISLNLYPGIYNYKYYVDGDWDTVNTGNRTAVISSTNSLVFNDVIQ